MWANTYVSTWCLYGCSSGALGSLEKAEIDTAHFKGNFPESCELHALFSTDVSKKTRHFFKCNNTIAFQVIPSAEESAWTCILPRTKVGAHAQHYFDLENVDGKVYSHVRVTIHPDGGIKRLRIIGKRAPDSEKVKSTIQEDRQ